MRFNARFTKVGAIRAVSNLRLTIIMVDEIDCFTGIFSTFAGFFSRGR